MGVEIEWKFLVEEMPSPPAGDGELLEQGYLRCEPPEVRVRTRGGRGRLTIKSAADTAADGPSRRSEFEYDIPLADAEELLALAEWTVRKRRYLLEGGIELDVYEGELAGLVVAEVETDTPGDPPDPPPGWRWRDVSRDPRFSNAALARDGLPRA